MHADLSAVPLCCPRCKSLIFHRQPDIPQRETSPVGDIHLVQAGDNIGVGKPATGAERYEPPLIEKQLWSLGCLAPTEACHPRSSRDLHWLGSFLTGAFKQLGIRFLADQIIRPKLRSVAFPRPIRHTTGSKPFSNASTSRTQNEIIYRFNARPDTLAYSRLNERIQPRTFSQDQAQENQAFVDVADEGRHGACLRPFSSRRRDYVYVCLHHGHKIFGITPRKLH
ncbi:hypothetical protein IWX49DRAFT_325276 [Phyllosticta citricarpa]|uniref:Uncharacterized protein n=1 Tax=Phyllosticta paracitricarpa TaxID=2016321 RepID=A0ABR1MWL0_9PEZI